MFKKYTLRGIYPGTQTWYFWYSGISNRNSKNPRVENMEHYERTQYSKATHALHAMHHTAPAAPGPLPREARRGIPTAPSCGRRSPRSPREARRTSPATPLLPPANPPPRGGVPAGRLGRSSDPADFFFRADTRQKVGGPEHRNFRRNATGRREKRKKTDETQQNVRPTTEIRANAQTFGRNTNNSDESPKSEQDIPGIC